VKAVTLAVEVLDGRHMLLLRDGTPGQRLRAGGEIENATGSLADLPPPPPSLAPQPPSVALARLRVQER
jgi:hypothetical protein